MKEEFVSISQKYRKGEKMKELLQQMLTNLDENKNMEHIIWLTENTPNRISGMGDDLKAAEYIAEKMKEYGWDSKILEFETYNSFPGESEIKVIYPDKKFIKSLPCCHILSTIPEGIDIELVYLGAGGYDDYVGKDVTGKAVLVEVSYSPATPEKARIAYEKGAAAMICMNWGNDENKDVICMRGLKAVWGNPTPESFGNIPQISGVSITRQDGIYLKNLCLNNDHVTINLTVNSSRQWQTLSQPMGILRGTEEPEKFLLVVGHLDAWNPGVTCNATGDGTILELCRVLGKFKDKIKRSICVVNWNGHEIAEAAGSAWFADHYFDSIDENCIGYINIDSTGLGQATVYKADASRELVNYAEKTITDVLGQDTEVQYLTKTGDQSFFGIGVPSIVGRVSYDDEYIQENNGATLGWWNHTVEDNLNKVDIDNLKKDLDVQCAFILGLINCNVLPYDFSYTCLDIKEKLQNINTEIGDIIDISELIKNSEILSKYVQKMNEIKAELSLTNEMSDKCKMVNKCLLKLSRFLTSAFFTYSDRYEQDSYGLSILYKPIPFLQDAVMLKDMNKEDEAYKLQYTKAIRNKNRVSDALRNAIEFLEAYMTVIDR